MRKALLTQNAEHAQVLADTFRSAFAATKVGDLVVEMTSPTDSTRGGFLARQHVTLRAPGGRTLVVGSVHAGEKAAQMKSFAAVTRLHEERLQRAPTFDEAAYQSFIATAESVLSAFSIAVTIESDKTPAPAEAPIELPKARKSRLMPALVIAAALLVLAAISWRFWRTSR